jgi:hypothetical protein
MLSRVSRSSSRGVTRAFATEVPINQVAAIYRIPNIGGEASAIKMDAFIGEQTAALKAGGAPGFLKTVRSVCKAEWAYEAYFVFADLDSFKTYKESPLRAELADRTAAAMEDIGIKMDDVYMGARVYDEM